MFTEKFDPRSPVRVVCGDRSYVGPIEILRNIGHNLRLEAIGRNSTKKRRVRATAEFVASSSVAY